MRFGDRNGIKKQQKEIQPYEDEEGKEDEESTAKEVTFLRTNMNTGRKCPILQHSQMMQAKL